MGSNGGSNYLVQPGEDVNLDLLFLFCNYNFSCGISSSKLWLFSHSANSLQTPFQSLSTLHRPICEKLVWWRFIESWLPFYHQMYFYSDLTFVQANMSSIQIYLDDNHSVSCNSSCSKFSVPSKRWRFSVKWWRFPTDTRWRWKLQKECTFRYILSPGVDKPARSFFIFVQGGVFTVPPKFQC